LGRQWLRASGGPARAMPAGRKRKRCADDLGGRERAEIYSATGRSIGYLTPPTPLKRGHWAPEKGTLTDDLRKDLVALRRQEARFLHKVLVWPAYTPAGKVRKAHAPAFFGMRSNSPLRTGGYSRDGFIYGVPYVRQELAAVARRMGADLKAARRFDAGTDMRRNLQVWCCSSYDCSMVEEKFFQRKGDRTGEFDIDACGGREIDEKRYAFGAVVQDGGRPYLNVTEIATGETHLYHVRDDCDDYRLPKGKRGMPPFLHRQLGMHNGAVRRRTYAGVRPGAVPWAARAQLKAAKAFEARWAAYRARLEELTRHGYLMAWYARPRRTPADRRSKTGREVREEYPEVVAEFEAADADRKRALFCASCAADYASQVLGAYLEQRKEHTKCGEGPALDEWVLEPLEKGIADVEVRIGPEVINPNASLARGPNVISWQDVGPVVLR